MDKKTEKKVWKVLDQCEQLLRSNIVFWNNQSWKAHHRHESLADQICKLMKEREKNGKGN